MDALSLRNRCAQALNFRRNSNKALPPSASSTLRTIAAVGAILLVSASAALGAYFGFIVGSHQHVLLGMVFASAALGGELLKPFAVSEAIDSLSRFHLVRALACLLLAAVCIVYSFTAELSLAAGSRGDMAASRQLAAEAARTARVDRSRAEADLALLAPARAAGEVQAEIEGLLLRPGVNGCTVIDGKVTREICPRVAELKAEKARAERRAELEADIRQAAHVVPAEAVRDADPLAGAVATYGAALGYKWDTATLLPWLALIPVLFLEIGSALAVVVVRSVGQRDTGSALESAPAVSQRPSETLPAGTPDRPAKPKRDDRDPPSAGTKPSPQRGIAAWVAAHANGTPVSVRKLARETGISKSVIHRTLQQLSAAGELLVDASRSGTRLISA